MRRLKLHKALIHVQRVVLDIDRAKHPAIHRAILRFIQQPQPPGDRRETSVTVGKHPVSVMNRLTAVQTDPNQNAEPRKEIQICFVEEHTICLDVHVNADRRGDSRTHGLCGVGNELRTCQQRLPTVKNDCYIRRLMSPGVLSNPHGSEIDNISGHGDRLVPPRLIHILINVTIGASQIASTR